MLAVRAMAASVPNEITYLQAQSFDPTSSHTYDINDYIKCEAADNVLIFVNMNTISSYLYTPLYTAREVFNYRGINIATWFNDITEIFEGEILLDSRQKAALLKHNYRAFRHIEYRYDVTNINGMNDLTWSTMCDDLEKKPLATFKLRNYVRMTLTQYVDEIFNIMHHLNIPADVLDNIEPEPGTMNYSPTYNQWNDNMWNLYD